MKLLVTGGAGFIGSNFIHYWINNYPEDEVVNLDKLTYAGNLESLRDVCKQKNYKFIKGDICDAEVVKEAIKGVDIVVHFAAESHVDRSIEDPAVFVRTNILGTHTLLEEAVKEGVKRFHHISTDEVFGSLKLDDPTKWTEESPYLPRSPYAASKASSDHLVRAYYTTYKLPITITNCSNNFGPYQFPEKFLPLAITNILEGKKIPVYGDGKNIRDWIYVLDHCRGIDAVLRKGEIGETYLIGTDYPEINNLNLAKMVAEMMGKDERCIEFVDDRPGHDRKYALDSSKIRTQLGWKPKWTFKKALEKTIRWYRENEWWWRPLKIKNEK